MSSLFRSVFRDESRKRFLFLVLSGLAAGFVNGLLGAGGGIIIVAALSPILKNTEEIKKADIFAMALSAMLPVSLFSFLTYLSRGALSFEGFGAFIIPAALGGILGALTLDKISASRLKKLFRALVIYSGIMMILK